MDVEEEILPAIRDLTKVTDGKVSTLTRKTKDRRLEKLELLHRQSNISHNLQLSPGHRLKLESSAELKRKRKPIPDFKLDYTELNELRKMNRTDYDSADLDDDEDDLPEAAEILSVDMSQKHLSATSFANSDSDSPILTVPLDDELPTKASERIESEINDRRTFVSHKKRRKAIEPKAINKQNRSKRLGLQSQCHEAISYALSQDHSKDSNHITKEHGPLFLSDDVDELERDVDCDEPFEMKNQLCSFVNDDDSFVTSNHLDCDLVNPDLTVVSNSIKLSGSQEARFATPAVLAEKALPRNNTYEKEKSIDDFAELDEWLNSGAVEIL
ncbi:hypothetical protein C0993_011103 [Termitomyces sp. T159_Od127]|nr:hypothetical protein C0993_011103 [Termitomyces sp. T159_Od127]